MNYYKQLIWLPTCIFLQLFIVQITNGQCNLSNLELEVTDCNETNFVDIIIDFDHTGEGNQGFTIFGNGNNYGNFEYSALPVTLFGIEGDCELEYEFIIRDIVDPTCSVFTEYGTICCDQSCMLAIDSLSLSACEDDVFNIFLYTNTNQTITSLNVFINNDLYGEVSYTSDTIAIEDVISILPGENEITICNALDSECCATYTFLNPCECATSNITAQIIECDLFDSSYYAIIDFEHSATSDSFQMGYSNGGNNNFLGVFAYNDLPVMAGPIFMSDDEREILIVDIENFFCFNNAFLGVVNDCNIECQIFNTFAEAYDCEDGQYYIDVEFDTEDIQGSTFDIIVDDVNYGSFKYGENFYTVGPINQNCDEAPVLEIQDTNETFCKDFFNFDDPICCGLICEFQVFEATADCNENAVIITFEYENLSTNEQNQLFVQFGNEEYGPYPGPSGSASISVPTLADGTYAIDIYVAGNESCMASTSFSVLCPTAECIISNVFAEAQECEDGTFFVDIEFDATDASETFEISGNGQSYGTFSYGETFYTVGPIEGDCETIYEFIIQDSENTSCSGTYSFVEPVCCSSCSYTLFDIGIIDCNDDLFTVVLDLEYEDTGDSVIIALLDTMFVENYSSFPLEIDSLPVGEDIEITITSATDTECSLSTNAFLESCFDALEDPILSKINILSHEGAIQVTNLDQSPYNYFLTSINGKSLTKGNLNAYGSEIISTQDLNTGVYLLTLFNNQKLETTKIIITQ